MKGRIWLLVGVAVGVAVGVGKLAYFAGAATSLSDTAQRLVGSGGHSIVRSVAGRSASRRTLNAITAVVAVLVPGVTALLLVYAARATLQLRAVVALVMAGLGVAAFFYLPHGVAAGAAVLAFVAAGIAVAATGPLVAAPLAALAALIATGFLPRILASHSTLPNVPVAALNQAIFAGAGSPVWLRVVVLVLAALPFVLATAPCRALTGAGAPPPCCAHGPQVREPVPN